MAFVPWIFVQPVSAGAYFILDGGIVIVLYGGFLGLLVLIAEPPLGIAILANVCLIGCKLKF